MTSVAGFIATTAPNRPRPGTTGTRHEKVLFICTGNYYRSRFAEELFNHLALEYQLDWFSDSAGIRAIESKPDNPGPISRHALDALGGHGVEPLAAIREPRQLSLEHLQESQLSIALSEREHRPMLDAAFDQRPPVHFWDVEDVHLEQPAEALGRLAERVHQLVEALIGDPAPLHAPPGGVA